MKPKRENKEKKENAQCYSPQASNRIHIFSFFLFFLYFFSWSNITFLPVNVALFT